MKSHQDGHDLWQLGTKERPEGIFLMGVGFKGVCICKNSLNCTLRFVHFIVCKFSLKSTVNKYQKINKSNNGGSHLWYA